MLRVSGVLRKPLLGLALLMLACAGLLVLAKPGWTQSEGEADLVVYKNAYGNNPTVVGESLYYEIYAYNNGPATATNVVLEDTLPVGLDFAGFFSGGDVCSYNAAARQVSCNIGDLPSFNYGGYAFFEVTPTDEGTLENTATVSSGTPDPDPSNNQDTATTEVVTPSADLEVSKSAPGTAFVDELLTYEISVNNHGPTAATNAVLEDTLPVGLDFAGSPDERCSYDEATRQFSCDLGNISAGGGEFSASASDYVSFEVRPTAEGTLENTATVSSDALDPDTSNNQDTATTEIVPTPTPPDSIVDAPGCQTNTLPRNDDGSTGAVALPFELNFFGQTYNQTFVNNNGNVTFDSPLSTYTPFDLSTTDRAIIAPFFADVDTRAQGSDEVTYGNISYGDRTAFCVNWTGVAGGVGYYAGHDDKLNSFQLLIVDRSDVSPGDVDIIMNYDKIRWETGDASRGHDGLGGDSARVGFSNGRPVNSFEFPGSAVNGAFLDSNPQTGLIHNSRDSLQLGRYVFEVRNGDAPVGGTISGHVLEQRGAQQNALPGSLVQVCDSDNSCVTSSTNSAGEYSASGLFDGEYNVRAFPPAGSNLQPNEIGPITLSNGETLREQNVVLTGPTPPPEGTSIDDDTPPGQIPVVIVGQPLQLETTGCEGGNATYEVTGTYGGSINGTMTEGPPGTYTADFSIPFTGPAEIKITIDCPGADDETIEFDIYIDPSGNVRDTDGDPIEGATVTLYRSDSETGPFTQVPDGSAIMSPANRDNPDLTDADGHFGWLTIAGFYIVRAEMDGCHAPGNPNQPFVETEVLPVPPEQVGLELILDCPDSGDETPPVLDLPDDISVEAASSDGATVEYEATATDAVDGDVDVSCDPASGSTFPLGETTVECSAEDAAGNTAIGSFVVTVEDTTDPTVFCDEPDGLWHKENVTIHCTASDFFLDGPASFTLSTSVPAGEENGNASTGTREVCDTSGNCATAGPIAGNKVDRKAPELTCGVNPKSLWPPNHKLVAVNASVTVRDAGSGPAGFRLTSATSDEPDNGLGDGDTPNDIQGFVVGTADTSGKLRAERSNTGDGRVYTLSYEGADAAGNLASCAVTVTVPHDQGRRK